MIIIVIEFIKKFKYMIFKKNSLTSELFFSLLRNIWKYIKIGKKKRVSYTTEWLRRHLNRLRKGMCLFSVLLLLLCHSHFRSVSFVFHIFSSLLFFVVSHLKRWSCVEWIVIHFYHVLNKFNFPRSKCSPT